MAKELKEITVKDNIIEELKKMDRTLMWLSNKAVIPYGTLYSCIVLNQFRISEKNLNKINKVLGTKFKNDKK